MSESVVYLGQQSWLIKINGTHILVDPILTQSIGHSPRLQFEVYPTRKIDTDKMPKIDAVVITNAHMYHFHPLSLRLLTKDVPVFMPELTPAVCVREVEQMGLRVDLLRHGQQVHVQDAVIKFFLSSPVVPFWESRASSVYVKPVNEEGGIYIQSDNIVDSEAVSCCKPDIFITTHNGQIAPEGHVGKWDNLLPLPSERAEETTGLELLQEILGQSNRLFPDARWILFSGAGFRQVPEKHGPFLWSDYRELEEIANSLRLSGPQVVGLVPGEAADFGLGVNRHMVDWIYTNISSANHAINGQPSQSDLPPIFDNVLTLEQQELIMKEFRDLSPLLMISRLGHHFINTNFYLDEPVGPYRFAVYLRGLHDGQEDAVLALNINRAQFEWLDLSLKETLYQIPFGIDVNASDLLAVFEGRIHFWEVATGRMRQWYVSNQWESPVAFLYSYLSEQVRPDLAEKLYENLRQNI